MKSRDIKELQTKTEAELRTLLAETKESLSASRLEHAQHKLTNTSSMRNMRDDIARVLTVLAAKMKNPTPEGEKAK